MANTCRLLVYTLHVHVHVSVKGEVVWIVHVVCVSSCASLFDRILPYVVRHGWSGEWIGTYCRMLKMLLAEHS